MERAGHEFFGGLGKGPPSSEKSGWELGGWRWFPIEKTAAIQAPIQQAANNMKAIWNGRRDGMRDFPSKRMPLSKTWPGGSLGMANRAMGFAFVLSATSEAL